MLAVLFNQLLWITFAPITGSAAAFYGVSDLSIGLLSMSFMIAYLVVSIPASWVIDTYGFRTAVGIGAVLTGVFGLMRGLVASNYTLVLVAQIGIAIGQPFILNCGDQSRRPLVPAARARHRLRLRLAGDLRRHPDRPGADAHSEPATWHSQPCC